MALILVTGSTDGIGLETALELARRGADVILHGRREDRLAEAVALVSKAAGRPMPAPVQGDFSSLVSVRQLAASLEERGVALDVLVNNAGIFHRKAELSIDGFELTFAVNHLAPFVLTHGLLAALKRSARPRVVNVSSMAHQRAALDLAHLPPAFDPYGSYAASKLANVLFSNEFGRRSGIASNSLHPGVVSTKLLTEGFGFRGQDSLATAAATSVKLAFDPALEGVTGRYFVAGREAQPARLALDAAFAAKFYEASARMAGVTPLPASHV